MYTTLFVTQFFCFFNSEAWACGASATSHSFLGGGGRRVVVVFMQREIWNEEIQ